MAYFSIYQGLRGCFMPDNTYIVQCSTRRELKRALMDQARDIRDAGAFGMSERAIAWLANAAWKNRKNRSGEFVAPYRWKYQDSYCNALGVFTGATLRDYKDQEND